MKPDSIIYLFIGGILIALIARIIADNLDRERIKECIRSQGGRVLRIHWRLFGTGWYGSRNERIYDVDYFAADQSRCRAIAKTSMMAGVYLTKDRIINAAKIPPRRRIEPPNRISLPSGITPRSDQDSLVAENERLREGCASWKMNSSEGA